MVKLTVALVIAFFVAGCSTTFTDRQMEAMHAPTLTLNCETGCSASYTDPRDRPKLPTNGWDTANAAINAAAGVVSSTAPWAAIGITAAEGIQNAVGDDSSDRSVTTDNSSREDNRDNSVRTDNRVNSTHEPTVVTQPEPQVVRPEVVQQPIPTGD